MSQPPLPNWAGQLPPDEKRQRLYAVHVQVDTMRNPRPTPRERFLNAWEIVVQGAPDRAYPSPEYTLKDGHPLIKSTNQALAAAQSFDEVAAIIDKLNSSLHEDSYLLASIKSQREAINADTAYRSPQLPEPYNFVEFDVVEPKVTAILKRFIAKATQAEGILHKETIRLGFPPSRLWHPPENWKALYPKSYAHLKTRSFPTVPKTNKDNGGPDLLLYALGSFAKDVDPTVEARLEACKKTNRWLLIADAAGAGKTRLILEYLAREGRNGLYFTFEADESSSPYGSGDLGYAINLIHDQKFRGVGQDPFEPWIPKSVGETENFAQQRNRWILSWENNTTIAEHVFANLLLSRLLIYEAFCTAATTARVGDKATLRRLWCLLQVDPDLSGDGDIFLLVFRSLSLLNQTAAKGKCEQLIGILSDSNVEALDVVAIDEAQYGTKTYSKCFGPNAQRLEELENFEDMTRPVLKPFVQTIIQLITSKKFIISGTKVNQLAVHDALTSVLAKRVAIDEDLNLLGENDNATRIYGTLDRFLGEEFSQRLKEDTRKEVLFWMQGRHRFLSVLISALLRSGPSDENVIDILLDIVSKLAGHNVRRPSGREFQDVAVSCLLPSILKNSSEFSKERQAKLRDLETAVFNFLITRRYSRHERGKPHVERLLEMGIARLAHPPREGIKIVLNENLIHVALWAWFSTSPPEEKSLLQRYLETAHSSANPTITGFGWEDIMAYMCRCWFVEQGKAAKDVFRFIGFEPNWASQPLRLVETLIDNKESDFVQVIFASPGTTMGLSNQTTSARATWQAIVPGKLDEDTGAMYQQRGYGVIKPDEDMGPDLLLICCTPTNTLILIAFQCRDREKALNTVDVDEILARLCPEDGWWMHSDGPSTAARGKYVNDIMSLFPAKGTEFETRLVDGAFVRPGLRSQSAIQSDFDESNRLPKHAILRVIAAPKIANVRNMPQGSYPAAFLSEEAIASAREDFPSIRLTLEEAQRAETREIQMKRRKTAASFAVHIPRGPVATKTLAKRNARTVKIAAGSSSHKGSRNGKASGSHDNKEKPTGRGRRKK